jgi:hypothetical protein
MPANASKPAPIPVIVAEVMPDPSGLRSYVNVLLRLPDGSANTLAVPYRSTTSSDLLADFIGNISGGRWRMVPITVDRRDLPQRLLSTSAQQAEFRAANAAAVSQHLERMRCPGAFSVGGTVAFSNDAHGLSRREQLMRLTALGRKILAEEEAARERNPI